MAKKKKAIITGITGQDGSYLAELLLNKGYKVYGVARRSSTEPFDRIMHILSEVEMVQSDLLDQPSIARLLRRVKPDEFYNLAAQSYVPTSFDQPMLTGEVTGLGVTRVLEAIRDVNPKIKFYQASSSEMFGKVSESPQTFSTPFYPRSPYGVAKLYGHWITINYRESYNMFAVSGILYNHESPRRGKEFVTRRISYNVARIKLGLQKSFSLGNLKAMRDWGFAGDYVEAMWRMLQQPKPEDYIVATGEAHSVKEFAEVAFNHVGLKWKNHITINPKLYRPAEVEYLCGDSSKARTKLKWKPKVNFKQLVEMMVDEDIKALQSVS